MYFLLVGAACSPFLPNTGLHCHSRFLKAGLSKSTFVDFFGRPPENIYLGFLSNKEAHLPRAQKSDCATESPKTEDGFNQLLLEMNKD